MWTQNLIVLHEYGEKDVLLTICLEDNNKSLQKLVTLYAPNFHSDVIVNLEKLNLGSTAPPDKHVLNEIACS